MTSNALGHKTSDSGQFVTYRDQRLDEAILTCLCVRDRRLTAPEIAIDLARSGITTVKGELHAALERMASDGRLDRGGERKGHELPTWAVKPEPAQQEATA